MRRRVWLAAVLVLLLVPICSTASATPFYNILSNPGFESGLSNWSTSACGANPVFATSRTNPGKGSACAFIGLEGTRSPSSYGKLSSANLLVPCARESYYCSAWNRRVYNTRSTSVTSSISLRCCDAGGKLLKVITVWSGRGGTCWRQFGMVIPAGAMPSGTRETFIDLKTTGATGPKGTYVHDYWDGVWFGENRVAPAIESLSVSQGEAFDLVTINGAHFYDWHPTVTSGGVAAPMIRDDFRPPSRLAVRVPRMYAGPTDLTVTNDYGRATVPFTVLPSNLPRITSISPESGDAGTLVTLKGEFLDPTSTKKEVWWDVYYEHFGYFGPVPDVISWTDTEITYLAPHSMFIPGSGVDGDGLITVRNDHGESNAVRFVQGLRYTP